MDLAKLTADLSGAIISIMDSRTSPEQRNLAYGICEDFKNTSPYCVECGLMLCAKENRPAVRHFGFHLLEHCIKFRWNDMKTDEKIFIRTNVLKILVSGTNKLLIEQMHIKEALTRIIVEIIKREWPQHWPNMLQEMNNICCEGETQKELVLLIFLRLAEDLSQAYNVPPRRKKELIAALSSNLQDLFSFFLTTLNHHYSEYVRLKSASEEKEEVLVHCHISNSVLKTLSGFLEWVFWSYISFDQNVLLRTIYPFLGDAALRISAVECLLLVVSRKGRLEERVPVLALFSEDAMSTLFAAANLASENILQERDRQYYFLKQLCQVLVELGLQLAALWGACDGVEQPSTFAVYLNCILTFAKHPSVVLSQKVLPLLNTFLQHSIISQNLAIRSIIPDITRISYMRLAVTGYPSKNDCLSCEFSRLDFDCDKDFTQNYSKFRCLILDILKTLSHSIPEIPFRYGTEMLLTLLKSSADGKCSSISLENSTEAAKKTEMPVQLDNVATFLDNVTHRMFLDDTMKNFKVEAVEVLNAILQFQSQDPTILQPFLSCMSATFVFLSEVPEMVPAVLEKLFGTVLFIDNSRVMNGRFPVYKNIRRHACACIFNICKLYTKMIMPYFNELYNHVKMLYDSKQLSILERCLLIEALVCISNEFQDYDKQSLFIKEIVGAIKTDWLNLTRVMCSAESFMTVIGIREAPKPLSIADSFSTNRLNIIEGVNVILGIVRRCRWPEDREVAQRGGFLCENNSEFAPYLHNAAAPHILPLLEGIFCFVKCVNDLHIPSIQAQFHPDFADILEMPESEKNLILGVNAAASPPPPLTDASDDTNSALSQPRIKNIVHYIYEFCAQILSHVQQYFGVEFYAMNNLSCIINQFLYSSVQYLPDCKLKLLFHYCLRSLVRACPPGFHHIIIPVFENLCPFMYQKLSVRWEKFQQQYGVSSRYEEEMTETKEILEDQLNRLLTREYLEILDHAIIHKASQVHVEGDSMEAETESKSTSSQAEKISDFGLSLLRTVELRNTIICTVFTAMHWLDSVASSRSIKLCTVVYKQLVSDRIITKEEEITFLFQSVIHALKTVGEHDINQSSLLSLGLLIYETMRPSFPVLYDILTQIPGCQIVELKKFDSYILGQNETNLSDKKKKENFKYLVSGIIGKHLGQHFKNDIIIENLPFPFSPDRPKRMNLEILEGSDLGLCALFGKNS